MKKGQKSKYEKPTFNGGAGLDLGSFGATTLGLNQKKAIQIGRKNKTTKRKKNER